MYDFMYLRTYVKIQTMSLYFLFLTDGWTAAYKPLIQSYTYALNKTTKLSGSLWGPEGPGKVKKAHTQLDRMKEKAQL